MPPDTAKSLVTAPTTEVLTDLPALTTLPVGVAPKGDPQPHLSFSLATPVQTPFCLSFPGKVSRNPRQALVTQRLTGAAPSPHVVCVPTQNVPGGSPHTDPTAPSPARALELLNHVLGSGCGRPVLPAASSPDPLLAAAAASCEHSWGSGSAGAPGPARAALRAQVQLRARSRTQSSRAKTSLGTGFVTRLCHGVQVDVLEGMVPLPNCITIPGLCTRPDLTQDPREALAEGAGGGFSWDVPGHVP